MKLTEIEERIVAAAPPDWLDQPSPPCLTVGQCAEVRRAWGTCMCLLLRALQNEKAKTK